MIVPLSADYKIGYINGILSKLVREGCLTGTAVPILLTAGSHTGGSLCIFLPYSMIACNGLSVGSAAKLTLSKIGTGCITAYVILNLNIVTAGVDLIVLGSILGINGVSVGITCVNGTVGGAVRSITKLADCKSVTVCTAAYVSKSLYESTAALVKLIVRLGILGVDDINEGVHGMRRRNNSVEDLNLSIFICKRLLTTGAVVVSNGTLGSTLGLYSFNEGKLVYVVKSRDGGYVSSLTGSTGEYLLTLNALGRLGLDLTVIPLVRSRTALIAALTLKPVSGLVVGVLLGIGVITLRYLDINSCGASATGRNVNTNLGTGGLNLHDLIIKLMICKSGLNTALTLDPVSFIIGNVGLGKAVLHSVLSVTTRALVPMLGSIEGKLGGIVVSKLGENLLLEVLGIFGADSLLESVLRAGRLGYGDPFTVLVVAHTSVRFREKLGVEELVTRGYGKHRNDKHRNYEKYSQKL